MTSAQPSSAADVDEIDRSLKAKHRAMWALGDYPIVVTDIIAELGPELVSACGVSSGDRVLDVGAGTGNAAIPAAQTGAEVVASDLTPELLEIGRQTAEGRGAVLRWEQGDVENLPYADGEFDVVMSCVGVMFAPHHQASANELIRVCRPGGRIGVLSWTPEGFIGQLFATMKPFAPPPPPGAQPPPLWGEEAHVRELFGDRITDIRAVKQQLPVTRFATPKEFREFFKSVYGPTIAVYRAIEADPERTATLDRELDALAERFDHGGSHTEMDWEYLLFTARRHGGDSGQ